MTSSADLKIPESDTEEKKLWLDYLARLRDRDDRLNQTTGVTNWVLYGLMGTILYRGIALLPIALSDRDYRYNTYLFVVLGLNLTVFGQLTLNELLPRIKGTATEIRALPELLRIFFLDYSRFLFLLAISLGLIEFWLVLQNPRLASVTRYCLIVFGWFHSVFGFVVWNFRYISRKVEGIRENVLPVFRGAALRGEWIAGLVVGVAAIASSVSIASHVRQLMHTSAGWLLSIQSSFGILVFSWAAYKVTILRPNRAQIVAAITELEQQVLLENLSVSEIRSRFDALNSGVRLKDWLQESSESLGKTWKTIRNHLDSTSIELDSVCSQSPTEAKLKVLKDLKQKIANDLTEYRKPFEATSVQAGAMVAIKWVLSRASSRETINRFKEFKREAEDVDCRLKALLKQLDAELIRTADELTKVSS